MRDKGQRVVVVPCSGIGKAVGSVSREAAYELCQNLRPDDTVIVALSKLVLGDKDTVEMLRRSPAVTIDGCKRMCASCMVRQSGGTIVQEATVFDAFRRHRELKPEGVAELNDDGKELARALAEEIATTVDKVGPPGTARGEDRV